VNHFASPDFWHFFDRLPLKVQELARENFKLLQSNPHHPSLHLKKVHGYWSVRVGLRYRALGTDVERGILWGWIGPHSEYDRLIG
jgi:hypothetical protein